ncbi:MAG: class I SAM-dependent methyltransferase [Thermodesulfobacteriota bacterium]
MSNCKYCEIMHQYDSTYPVREAKFDLESDFPRCEWHWRFVCSVCGKSHHFNGTTWCGETGKFLCFGCAKDHKVVPSPFWAWDYHYEIGCPFCNGQHAALDRLEYEGRHPWQLDSAMENQCEGLSKEAKLVPGFMWERVVSEKEDTVTDEEIALQWNNIARPWDERYSEFGDISRQYIIDPAIFRMLGDVHQKRVLDAGCGAGYLCRLLAKRGAQVVGVDLCPELIKMAREREEVEPLGIRYYRGSISDMSCFASEDSNLVVSNYVVCDVRDYKTALKEIARVLKPEGRLVFSIGHPCFASPPGSGWVKRPWDSDRNEDKLFWKVDNYFDRVRGVLHWLGASVSSFHRPLSDYFQALDEAGLTVIDFEEPVPSREAIKANPRAFFNDSDRIPYFLVMAACKRESFPKFAPSREGIPDRQYNPRSSAEVRDMWNRNAKGWAQVMDKGNVYRQLTVPAFLELVGDVTGLRILDAGCGEGNLTRMLAQRGAKVIGVDISEEMIRIARQKEAESPLGIEYVVGDLSCLSSLSLGTFDVVVCFFVLMDLPNHVKVIREIHRVLKPKGRFLIAILHPCFNPPVHGWERCDDEFLFYKVDRYFYRVKIKEPFVLTTTEGKRQLDYPRIYFHRPLEDYIHALLGCGFRISKFVEPTPTPEIITSDPQWEKCGRIPYFLIMEAIRS